MRKETVLVWHKYNSKLYVYRQKTNINLSCFHASNKGNRQQKTWFLINISGLINWQRKHVSVTLRLEYSFLINKNNASSAWNSSIYPKNSVEALSKQILNKNSYTKDFWKPSVLVWHGQNCNMSQIRTKRMGAWPLFFLFSCWHIYLIFLISVLPNLEGKKYIFGDVTLTRTVPIWGVLPFYLL